MEVASLGVDAENPTGALGLYEGLGFQMTKRSAAYRKAIEPALSRPVHDSRSGTALEVRWRRAPTGTIGCRPRRPAAASIGR